MNSPYVEQLDRRREKSSLDEHECPIHANDLSVIHSPSRFLFLARSASRTSWLGAASARSSSGWAEPGGSVPAGPSDGIAPGGGRDIITGGPVAAPSGKARPPPDVWCRELWAAIGPLAAATGGCWTAADIDRSTPPSNTGRQPPPEAPLPLTAGRIPPPPGSGAYGRYSSSLRTSSCDRV